MFYLALICYAYSAYAMVRSVAELLFGNAVRRAIGSDGKNRGVGYFGKAIIAVLLATLFALSQ